MKINEIDKVVLDNMLNGNWTLVPFSIRWNEETKRNEKFPYFPKWNGESDWKKYAASTPEQLQEMLDKCNGDNIILQAVLKNVFCLDADMHADKETGEILNGGGVTTLSKWDAEFGYTPTFAVGTPTNGGQKRMYGKPSGTLAEETRLVNPNCTLYPQIETLVVATAVWGKGYKIIDASVPAYRPDYLYGIIEKPKTTIGSRTSEFNYTPEQELQLATDCVNSLSRFRSDDRDSWKRVLMILRYQAELYPEQEEQYKKLAIEFSKQCRSKWYEEEYKFDDTWETLNPNGDIGIGSLVHWAKEDDVNFVNPFAKPVTTSISIGDGEVVDIPKIKDVPTISDEKLKEFIKVEKDSLSDWGNAMRLINLYGDILRFNASFGWIIWNGMKWEIDPDNSNALAHRYSHLTARSIRAEAAKITKESVAEAWGKWAHQSHSSYHLEKMLEEAKSELTRKTEVFYDNQHWLLNAENGILNLKTGTLMQHDRKYHITKVAGTPFIPDATCPKWESFMEMIFPNPEVRKFVQTAVGYSLTGNSDEREFFFLYDRAGKGDNGKSTFIRTLLLMFGEYGINTSIDAVLATQRGGLTPFNEDFMNRRFVSTDELPSNTHMSTNTMKKLTGNDIISCNPKHRRPFNFPPTHALWIFGNQLPVPDNKSDLPFYERMKPIAFENKIPAEIKKPMEQVLADFRSELPGILNWALAGLKIYQAEGLIDPAVVKADAKNYQDEYDYFSQFLKECFLDIGNKKVQAKMSLVLNRYNQFLEENQEKGITIRALGKKMREIGITVGGKGDQYYLGISFDTPTQQSIGNDADKKSQPQVIPSADNSDDEL